MSPSDPAPTAPQKDIALAAAEASFSQAGKAFGKLIERITSWLVETGNWIFSGLTALILVIIASLITVGPVDRAITLATAAFAVALPLNLAGLVLLRLVQDTTARVGHADEWTQAFQDVGFPVEEQAASPRALESRRKRIRVLLFYSLGVLVLSVLLTVTGLIAALWHMAWWIGVAFFAAAIASLGVVIAAVVTSAPPESPEQKERNRRYWQEMMRRASEQSTRKNESA